jgi:hypothetical protein
MSKRIIICVLTALFFFIVPVKAATSIEYLKEQSLTEESLIRFKTLSMVANCSQVAGNDVSKLKNRLTIEIDKQKLPLSRHKKSNLVEALSAIQ